MTLVREKYESVNMALDKLGSLGGRVASERRDLLGGIIELMKLHTTEESLLRETNSEWEVRLQRTVDELDAVRRERDSLEEKLARTKRKKTSLKEESEELRLRNAVNRQKVLAARRREEEHGREEHFERSASFDARQAKLVRKPRVSSAARSRTSPAPHQGLPSPAPTSPSPRTEPVQVLAAAIRPEVEALAASLVPTGLAPDHEADMARIIEEMILIERTLQAGGRE
jgi:septal ring factor EnvC (AmiA/AmiB activator)